MPIKLTSDKILDRDRFSIVPTHTPPLKRFWEKVNCRNQKECWEWQAGRSKDGYGQFWLEGRTQWAHRIAWKLTNGPIRPGLFVLHKCPGGGNPACCNPAHLKLGNHVENMLDRNADGRTARGDRHGARLYPERMRRMGNKNGSAKLNDEQVQEIRSRFRCGQLQREIAIIFEISQQQVSKIVRRIQRV